MVAIAVVAAVLFLVTRPDPTSDIRRVNCTAGTVTVTNRSSETSDYRISVEVRDEQARLNVGTGTLEGLAPGRSGIAEVDWVDPFRGEGSCVVTEVHRTAS